MNTPDPFYTLFLFLVAVVATIRHWDAIKDTTKDLINYLRKDQSK